MQPYHSTLARDKLAANYPREFRLFWAIDDDGDGRVRKADVARVLESNGLIRKDRRLGEMFTKFDECDVEALDFPAFLTIVQSAGTLFERTQQGDLVLPDFEQFSDQLAGLFGDVAQNQDGTQATYIPPLAEVDPEQFAMAVMTTDGQLLELGKTETDFSVQSACKPFNYCFALDEHGEDKVHRHIGMEPSGQPFNARVLMSDGTLRPHNPMVNAGAIMTAALTKTDDPLHRRQEHVRNVWAKMTGGAVPRLNAWMAQEESRTGDNNRALGYMMKDAGVLPNGADTVDHELRDALELYFSMCSLEITARELATAAAALANNGICPASQERVFSEDTVRNCLTMMQMCGMYDGSGEFSMSIGVPAKSGVGGAVLLVVPRLMGVCIWSPRLDAIGNSVRGVDMAKRLAQTYQLHIYDGVAAKGDRVDLRIPIARWRALITSQTLWAASSGDVRTLRRLFDDQANLASGDYDLRTPMHLSAAEGHLEVVRFLLEHDVDPNTPDRWGGTPLDDAQLGEHADVIDLLKQHDAKPGNAQHLTTASEATEPSELYGDTDAVVELLWAASENEVEGLRRCVANGIPLSAADYDGRTALHLAAAEGQIEAVQYLLAHHHPIHVRDRWQSTPLDEARREGRDDAVALLDLAREEFHATKLAVKSAEIARAADFVNRFTAAYGISPLVGHRVNVVLDDVLSNIVACGHDDPESGHITLAFALASDRLDVVVTDDGRALDPLAHEAPDPTGDLETMDISGMGIELLRQLTDDASYRRDGEQNILTLSFGLAGGK